MEKKKNHCLQLISCMKTNCKKKVISNKSLHSSNNALISYLETGHCLDQTHPCSESFSPLNILDGEGKCSVSMM